MPAHGHSCSGRWRSSGSADQLNTPDAARSSGAAVLDDRRLRVLIAAEPHRPANAVPGARVSVLVTDITTYESIQWKGTVPPAPRRAPPATSR